MTLPLSLTVETINQPLNSNQDQDKEVQADHQDKEVQEDHLQI